MNKHLKAKEYECLVKDLISNLAERSPVLPPCDIAGSGNNKIGGASGFKHQIDVSVRAPSFLILVECKYWSDSVDAEPLLVLASRLADIRAANPKLEILASLVSTKAPTSGAEVLATYFGINLDIVSSIKDYAVRLRKQIFTTIGDTVIFGDSCDGEVNSGPGNQH